MTVASRVSSRVAGGVVGGLFLLAIVPLVAANTQMRYAETQLTALVLRLVLGIPTSANGTVVMTGLGTIDAFGMNITTACSVALLIVPLLVVAAVLVGTGRVSVLRMLPVVLVAAAVLVLLNQARFLLIVVMTRAGGMEAFGWAHTVFGSILVIAGLVAVLFFFVKVSARERKGARP